MAGPQPNPKSAPECRPAAPVRPAGGGAEIGAPPDVSKLTPEEQMAAFEKDLKENDWGHQPC